MLIGHEHNMNDPVSPLSNPHSIDLSSPDSTTNDFNMKELKRKKQQLEHQLAEKQKQEQIVKVRKYINEQDSISFRK